MKARWLGGALRAAYALLVAGVLVIALLPPREAIDPFGWDKLDHVAAFAVLAGLARLLWPRLPLVIPCALLALLGGGIEILQWAEGMGRDADWHDFVADAIGIGLGVLFAAALRALRIRAQAMR